MNAAPTTATALLVAVVLAGCGSSDSSTKGSTSGGSSVTTTVASIQGAPADSPYEAGLRAAYTPVRKTLDELGASCNPLPRAKLAQCRAQLTAFLSAVARLQKYVSDMSPPAGADTEAQQVGATLTAMHKVWSQLAAYQKQGNLAAANAMAGLGKPLTNTLMAFITALRALDTKLPGESLPLPGG
jgi:hypothetical protein